MGEHLTIGEVPEFKTLFNDVYAHLFNLPEDQQPNFFDHDFLIERFLENSKNLTEDSRERISDVFRIQLKFQFLTLRPFVSSLIDFAAVDFLDLKERESETAKFMVPQMINSLSNYAKEISHKCHKIEYVQLSLGVFDFSRWKLIIACHLKKEFSDYKARDLYINLIQQELRNLSQVGSFLPEKLPMDRSGHFANIKPLSRTIAYIVPWEKNSTPFGLEALSTYYDWLEKQRILPKVIISLGFEKIKKALHDFNIKEMKLQDRIEIVNIPAFINKYIEYAPGKRAFANKTCCVRIQGTVISNEQLNRISKSIRPHLDGVIALEVKKLGDYVKYILLESGIDVKKTQIQNHVIRDRVIKTKKSKAK